ncbi:MAG: autotransporter domain-containing protein, partial [Deltaproteobacteria bacterium]|nr:autotransporter domain-containing protein [Deltaproteobacteria bacterium]
GDDVKFDVKSGGSVEVEDGGNLVVDGDGGSLNVDGGSLKVDDDGSSAVLVSGEGSSLNIGATADSVADIAGAVSVTGKGAKINLGAKGVVNVDGATITLANGSATPGDEADSFDISGVLNLKNSSTVTSPVEIAVKNGGTLNSAEGNNILDGGLRVETGGLFKITQTPSSNTFQITNGDLTVDGEGTLDLGTNHLNVATGTATLKDKSVLKISADASLQGQLQSNTIIGPAAGEVVLLDLQGDFDDTTPILSATTMSGAGSYQSFAYDLDVDPSSGTVKVGDYKGLGAGVEMVADSNNFAYTGNFSKAAGLITRVYEEQPNGLGAVLNGVLQALYLNNDSVNAELALRQLIGESVLNVAYAVNDVALKAQGVVYGRLDKIRSSSTITPPSAGSADDLNRLWIGGFGSWARQSDRDGVLGYKYRSGGFALGYDRHVASVPGLLLGLSAAFSYGKIDSNGGLSDIDVKTAGFGLYASYTLSNNFFIDAQFGYANRSNDSTVALATGGTKTGSFDIDSWQLGARVGYNLVRDSFTFTPSIGLRYLSYKMDGWNETVVNAGLYAFPGNSFKGASDHLLEIPVELKFSGNIQSGSAVITPEFRVGYTFVADRPDNVLNVGFVGTGLYATYQGIRPARGSFQVGAGLKVDTGGPVDIFVNYDLNVASGFTDHKASAGIGFQF